MDKSISSDLEQIIAEKKTVMINENEGKQFYSITADEQDTDKYSAQLIVPIVSEGDPIGAVIVLSKEPGVVMTEMEVKVAETAAGFLGRQMEQ